MSSQEVKYIGDLNPLSPRKESFIVDGIKDITRIKKALIASFIGFNGPILVHAAMDPDSTAERIKLGMPFISYGNGEFNLSPSDNVIVVFRSTLNNAKGVKIALGSDQYLHVMDSRGQFLEADAIRANGVNILTYFSTSYHLLGYVNQVETRIPEPAATNRNQFLGNDGADFIWSDVPVPPLPPKELPDLTGHKDQFLKVDEATPGSLTATWSDVPVPPKELPDLTDNKDKALYVIESPTTKRLAVAWEAVQEALPPLEGQKDKVLRVIEDPDTHQLKAVWENVAGELPDLTDNKDMFLGVVQTSPGSLGIRWLAVPSALPPIIGKRGHTLQVAVDQDENETIEWRRPGRELPDYRNKAHKLLSVVEQDGHKRLAWVDRPTGLPPLSGAKDKILRVVEDVQNQQLTLAWQAVPEALPPIDGEAGKALLVIRDPTSGQLKASWENSTGKMPDLNGHLGDYLRVKRVNATTLGIGWETLSALPDVTGNEGKVLKVFRDEAQGLMAAWREVPEELPELDDSKVGKFLRVKKEKDGTYTLTWRRVLPFISSEDEGFILTIADGKPVWKAIMPMTLPPPIALSYF